MKAYIKHKFFLNYLFFVLIFNVATTTVAQGATSYQFEGYVKIKFLGKTAQDALQLYREIGATPQQVAVPYMILSFLGHPNYPAISQNDSVCFFMYSSSSGCDWKYIILAKLQETSNLKGLVEGLKWGVEEYAGWTLFAKNKEDFQIIGNKNELLRIANEKTNAEVEFNLKPNMLSLTRFRADGSLHAALSNLDNAVWNLNFPEGGIIMNGYLKYKREGDYFGSWLERNANCWGLHTKVLSQNARDSKVQISLNREGLANFFNQWRASVATQEDNLK